MRLEEKGLKDKVFWEERGYRIPGYDRKEMVERTRKEPGWIHFGAGNLFRALPADLAERLLDRGEMETGIVAVERNLQSIEQIYRPHDGYYVLVTWRADGTMDKKVVGSIGEVVLLEEEGRLSEIFAGESLKMASFTITEKGYRVADQEGALLPEVKADIDAGPDKARTYLGKVTALLYRRFLAGEKPLALVSMDNCSKNGRRLYEAVREYAEGWEKKGLVEKGFVRYVDDPGKVSFPWTMVDKITPRPSRSVEIFLAMDGLEGMEICVTRQKTYTAPFVNAEESEYLVIQDKFPAGRPRLERAGAIFTDRETVERAERMKVCVCLNPLHTALAVFGCLLGFGTIAEEMKDLVLRRLVEKLGYGEGLAVVEDPGILDPEKFLEEVIEKRMANPSIPDTPWRIATDTSQKLAVRFGETIKAYQKRGQGETEKLVYIPLVLAGWLRYLTGIDDAGGTMELSPDPLMEHLKVYGRRLKAVWGKSSISDQQGQAYGQIEKAVHPLLEDQKIFGVDLYEAGLAGKICGYLEEMLAGTGAVRETLEKYVK